MAKRPANYAQLVKQARAIATQGHVPTHMLTTTSVQPETKLAQLRKAYAAGEFQKAVAIAAKFPVLGNERDAVLLAHNAYTNPRFVTQMGSDPEKLKQAGIAALRTKYSL